MLTEEFVASVGVPSKPLPASVIKDASIVIHEFQPLLAQRSVYKKSSTLPRCLATSDNHVFAAQAEKAVLHVYDRKKGSQEATVPFTERISSLTLACENAVLAVGTVEGRVILWETTTGRQVSTARSHLQAVTCVVTDRTSNFLLSSSADSTVHVWSIQALLSFANLGQDAPTPFVTFSGHKSEVTSLALGHSHSLNVIAASISKDRTCLIWEVRTATLLRTFLLPEVPTCLTMDPADRAIYIGYQDGSLQSLDMFSTGADAAKPTSVLDGKGATAPVQPSPNSRWRSSDTSHGAVLSISLSFDGSILITGHESGQVLSWEVGRRAFRSALLQNILPGPVNNLLFLPVVNSALASSSRGVIINSIVKPKFGSFDTSDGTVPLGYTTTIQLGTTQNDEDDDDAYARFMQSLTATCLDDELISAGMNELLATRNSGDTVSNGVLQHGDDDYMELDGQQVSTQQATAEENSRLKAQNEALRNLQTASFKKIEQLSAERNALLKKEQRRLQGGATNTDDSE